MRVLVVNHFPVVPARIGGQMAVQGLVGALAQRWPTRLLWTERDGDWLREMDIDGRSCEVCAVPNPWRQRRITKWLSPWLGRADGDIGAMLCSAGHRRLMQRLLQLTADGDLVVLAHPWLWPAVERLMSQRALRLVYDAHNVESALKAGSFRTNWLSRRVLRRLATLEADLVRRADLTLACTAHDAQTLADLAGVGLDRFVAGSKACQIAPPAASAAAARQARGTPAASPVALFIGSNHPPNNEAARWICSVLAPSCPGWRFRIVGSCARYAGPAGANVELLGPVDDLSGPLAECDVALNPMLSGSGINMKLFDYLQYGLPVVTTAIGARGLEHLTANGLLMAPREGFAQALGRLRAEPALYAALSGEGPRTVATHFTWPVVAGRLCAAIAGLAAGGGPAHRGGIDSMAEVTTSTMRDQS